MSSKTASGILLQYHLQSESSQYGTAWPTRLDKIKNLYLEVRTGPLVSD